MGMDPMESVIGEGLRMVVEFANSPKYSKTAREREKAEEIRRDNMTREERRYEDITSFVKRMNRS